jgi:class 3 adenylate cyclase/CheY-like chemotaxis protein
MIKIKDTAMFSVPPQQILIVDDSPLQAIVLRRILVQAGFPTITAKDGIEALECLKKNNVSLIISDINMPNMDGFELCKQVKTNEKLRQIPVILCTTLTDPEDLIHGIEVEADNYITRPYNSESLLRVIQDLLNAPLRPVIRQEAEDVEIEGRRYSIRASRQHILNFLLTTYRNILQQNKELVLLREEIQKAYLQLKTAQKEQEQLLLNIFPESVANELIAYGSVTPLRFDDVSVMFIDFVGFSKSARKLSPRDLIQTLEYFFDKFDEIIDHHHLERIKTMGDGYMCVGGLPVQNKTHAIDCIRAALHIQKFVQDSFPVMQEKYGIEWQARIGINSGPVVAGVVGKKRFAYDVWGDTVNLASRMESHCEAGRVNVSKSTYEKTSDYFTFLSRGTVAVRNKEGIEFFEDMYFVQGPKPGINFPS